MKILVMVCFCYSHIMDSIQVQCCEEIFATSSKDHKTIYSLTRLRTHAHSNSSSLLVFGMIMIIIMMIQKDDWEHVGNSQ